MTYRSRLSKRMGVGGLAAVAAAAMVLGACGSATPASAPPQQAVTSAFSALGSQPGIEMRISLGVTGKELQQMSARHGSDGLTLAEANDLAATSIVVDLNTGTSTPLNDPASNDRNDQFGLAVHVGTASAAAANRSDPVDLRYVQQTFYLRADLPGLLTDLGQSPSGAAGFQKALESPVATSSGLAALGEGKWVSVPASTLAGLLQGLQSMIPGAAGTSGSSTSGQQVWLELQKAFNANAHYTRAGTGSPARYTATLAVKPFVQDVEQLLPASLGNIPGASSIGKQVNNSVNRIGNRKVVASLWVSGNKVQEVDVDLNQFDHSFGVAVPLRIQFSPGETVQAPPQATQLNLSNIGQMLGGMLSRSSAT